MMDIRLPQLDELKAMVSQAISSGAGADPAWYNLKAAHAAKGGCAYETMRTRRWLQPKGGHFDAYIGGVGVWSAETIREWLAVTDDQLAQYHKKYRTGARSPRTGRYAA